VRVREYIGQVMALVWNGVGEGGMEMLKKA